VPGTYHSEAKNQQGIISIIEAPFKGMYDVVDIIFFILITGSFIAIFYESGALDKGIRYLAVRMKGKENSLIIIFTFLFALVAPVMEWPKKRWHFIHCWCRYFLPPVSIC
jgi:uncharacterized ion transporter superfamily protein YfcC